METNIQIQPELKKAFDSLGFSEFTEIQLKAIPLIQHGKDVIGQSHTGSGKTAAFGFPILEKLTHNQGLQALVLVPTRELCEQVMSELRKFAKYKKMNINAIYGGVSINPQIDQLRYADMIVGTPGRLLDHLERGTLNLKKIKVLVLDEADKMFEMGFIDDVKKIISQTPKERQTLLFSATVSHEVHEIVKHYMKAPEKIKVKEYVDELKLSQYFYTVPTRDKFSLLVHVLKNESQALTIIFCATRNRVDVVSKNLYKQQIQSIRLHGGLSQAKRKQSIDQFHNKEVNILVASDVAARGLDIKNVSHIINYDAPKTSKEYIHRIGRTARAGEEGKVISLISEPDHENWRNVTADRSLTIEQLKAPEFEKLSFIAHVRSDDDGRSGYGQRSFNRGPRSYGSRPHSSGPRRFGSHSRSESSSHSEGERSYSSHSSSGSSYQGHRRSGPPHRFNRN